jgi:hypothetical protein
MWPGEADRGVSDQPEVQNRTQLVVRECHRAANRAWRVKTDYDARRRAERAARRGAERKATA